MTRHRIRSRINVVTRSGGSDRIKKNDVRFTREYCYSGVGCDSPNQKKGKRNESCTIALCNVRRRKVCAYGTKGMKWCSNGKIEGGIELRGRLRMRYVSNSNGKDTLRCNMQENLSLFLSSSSSVNPLPYISSLRLL